MTATMAGRFPRFGDPAGTGASDFGRNGWFLVVRRLDQDVEGFWNSVDRHVGELDDRYPHLADVQGHAVDYDADLSGRRKGLLFMALRACIERQFEFVQHTWLTAPSFHGLSNEVDLVAGQACETGSAPAPSFTIPTASGPVTLEGMRSYVTARGGGYFFLPSRSALSYLAALQRFGEPATPARTNFSSGSEVIARTLGPPSDLRLVPEGHRRACEAKAHAAVSRNACTGTAMPPRTAGGGGTDRGFSLGRPNLPILSRIVRRNAPGGRALSQSSHG